MKLNFTIHLNNILNFKTILTFFLFKSQKDVWVSRKDNQLNQAYDIELIKEEKRLEVEEAIRIEVDELMREELKNLKTAIDKTKDIKKKKKKGKKKNKKKKKKKEKDLTPDRTVTELFTELVEQGIIIKPHNSHLSDFEGEYSYLGTTLRQAGVEPMPSLTDVRHLAALYGILHIGTYFFYNLILNKNHRSVNLI